MIDALSNDCQIDVVFYMSIKTLFPVVSKQLLDSRQNVEKHVTCKTL